MKCEYIDCFPVPVGCEFEMLDTGPGDMSVMTIKVRVVNYYHYKSVQAISVGDDTLFKVVLLRDFWRNLGAI